MNRILLLILIALSSIGVAAAQDDSGSGNATETNAEVQIDLSGQSYDIPRDEPTVLIVQTVTTNERGVFVTGSVFWRNVDGSLSRLTACDDVMIPCSPLSTEATSILEGQPQGVVLGLSDEALSNGS